MTGERASHTYRFGNSDSPLEAAVRPAASVAAIILAAVALAHAFRIVFHVQVVVGEVQVPMWTSVLAFMFAAVLAIALWRESRR